MDMTARLAYKIMSSNDKFLSYQSSNFQLKSAYISIGCIVLDEKALYRFGLSFQMLRSVTMCQIISYTYGKKWLALNPVPD